MTIQIYVNNRIERKTGTSFFHAQCLLFNSRRKFGLLYCLSTVAGLFCCPGILDLITSQGDIQLLIQRTVPLPFITLLIAVGMYVLNDLIDSDLDRANSKSSRPIPSGLVSRKQAWIFILLTNGSGIILSAITFNMATILLVVPMTLIGILYSAPKIALMSRFVVKNLSIALFYMLCAILGITFSYGIDGAINASIESIHSVIMLGIMIFVGSIVNDSGDIRGDKQAGRRTIPIVLGGEKTLKLLIILLASMPVLSWMMFYADIVIIDDNNRNNNDKDNPRDSSGDSLGKIAHPIAVSIVAFLGLARISKLGKRFEDMEFVRKQHKKWFPLHMVLQSGIIVGGFLLYL